MPNPLPEKSDLQNEKEHPALDTQDEEDCLASVKFFFKPNMTLLPLKLTIFFYCCSAFALLPYLTIHMKDIGISVEHIAIIYAILPFVNLISSPLVGFLADRLGSYTRVLILSLLGDALFFTLLLAIPHVTVIELDQNNDFVMADGPYVHINSTCIDEVENCASLNESVKNVSYNTKK